MSNLLERHYNTQIMALIIPLERDLGILMQFMKHEWVLMAILEQKIPDLETNLKFFCPRDRLK